MRIVILSSIWRSVVEKLQQDFDCLQAVNPTESEKRQLLTDAEVVIVRSPVQLDREVLEFATQLRLIIRAGSGLELIDRQAAAAQGIQVVSIPLSNDSVAEHTFGLMLALARRLPQLCASLAAGKWEKYSDPGMELNGKTLGLIGFGRIGRRTAELGAAFGMSLVSYDRSPQRTEKQTVAQALGVQFVELECLFQQADVITIQTPLNEQTAGLVDSRLLGSMKTESLIINVGRGGIIDEDALYDALSTGSIAGAALDVFENEPPIGSKLFGLRNFVGTPHVAAQTNDAQRRVGENILEVINAWVNRSGEHNERTDQVT